MIAADIDSPCIICDKKHSTDMTGKAGRIGSANPKAAGELGAGNITGLQAI